MSNATPEEKSKKREYDRRWRAKRRAQGLPSSGSDTWDEHKFVEWKTRYYSDPKVRSRKAESMRASLKRNQHKVSARRLVRSAIDSGKLKRLPCEICGASITHAHHEDYAKSLDVRWLCRKHHDECHRANAEGCAE